MTREITRKYADDKKISKKEKDEKYETVLFLIVALSLFDN